MKILFVGIINGKSKEKAKTLVEKHIRQRVPQSNLEPLEIVYYDPDKPASAMKEPVIIGDFDSPIDIMNNDSIYSRKLGEVKASEINSLVFSNYIEIVVTNSDTCMRYLLAYLFGRCMFYILEV